MYSVGDIILAIYFGVAGHTPDELILNLKEIEAKPYFYVVPPRTYIQNKNIPNHIQHVICLTREDFLKNFQELSKTNKRIYVFASTAFLLEHKGFNRLDYSLDTDDTTKVVVYDYIDFSVLKNPASTELKRKKTSYTEALIKKVKDGSIFNNLMTYIYKLPAKTHQRPINNLSCNYLRHSWSEDRLAKELQKLGKDINLSTGILANITEILTSAIAKKYQAAFKEIRDEQDVIPVSEAHKLSSYEMMYILKMLEHAAQVKSKEKVSIDEYLAHNKD